MIRLKITDEQIEYATYLVNNCNYGRRGKFDGDKSKQLVGMLAQTVLADYLKQPRPDTSEGFDGGYDYIINGKKVDVKCMSRKGYVIGNYVHNLIAYQKNYDVDYYIFTSLNTTTNELEICGVIHKAQFFSMADLFEKGTVRHKGKTAFTLEAPTYELKQYKLHLLGNVDDVVDIYTKIR